VQNVVRSRPSSRSRKDLKQEREALDKEKEKYESIIVDNKSLNDENRALKENFNRLSLENQTN